MANGTYYFEHTFALSTSPRLSSRSMAELPSRPKRCGTSRTISPKDYYIDEPIPLRCMTTSGTTSTTGRLGRKGNFLENIGEPADASSAASLFGKALLYKELTRGDAAGASDGNNVKQVYARVGAPVGADISADLQSVVTTLDGAITAARIQHQGRQQQGFDAGRRRCPCRHGIHCRRPHGCRFQQQVPIPIWKIDARPAR